MLYFGNKIEHMIRRHIEQGNPLQQYKSLQKQLNEEHNRLLRQREQMLQRQNDRLAVYQKLDLVEFFNYSPSTTQNKETMMYHLSEKFKDYMRKLTENNVYKRQGRLGGGQDGIRRQLFTERASNGQEKQGRNVNSPLHLRRMSNVERNSELGRMFQTTMRYCQGTRVGEDKLSSKYPSSSSRNNHRVDSIKNKYPIPSGHLTSHLLNTHSGDNALASQMQQLRVALAQQQKIYLLTELNHYIKLYKQSQTRSGFLNKHLQNLHQFILDMRINQHQHHRSQSADFNNNNTHYKLKPKTKHYPNDQQYQHNTLLRQQNAMLRKQLQIYIDQLNAINSFTAQQQYLTSQGNSNNNNNTLSHTGTYCPQVKRVDRFKQFAQHIKIMQLQLDGLITKAHITVNANDNIKQQSSSPSSHQLLLSTNKSNQLMLIDELYRKIGYLERVIQRQQTEKGRFFEQVKKFKQLMNIKSQQITTLENQLQTSQQLVDRLKQENSRLCIQINQSSIKHKDSSTENISQFITRTLNKNQPYQQLASSTHCRGQSTVTTTPSQEFQFRGSRVQQHSNSENYGKDNCYCQPVTVRNSRSKSKHSARTQSKDSYRKKINAGDIDSYEPKPYDRYRKITDYNSTHDSHHSLSSTGPLYQRISNYYRQQQR